MPISVREGDLRDSRCQVIAVFLDSSQPCAGSVALAVKDLVGPSFAQAASRLKGAGEGESHLLRVQGFPFEAVLLVVDTLSHSLQNLLEATFRAVQRHGYTSVALPAVRLGLQRNVGETVQDKLRGYVQVGRRVLSESASLEEIEFVFYGDALSARELRARLKDRSWSPGPSEADLHCRRLMDDFKMHLACFSGDGKRMALPVFRTGVTPIRLVEIATGRELSCIEPECWTEASRLDALALDHRGERLLVVLRFGGQISLYETAEGRCLGHGRAPAHAKKGMMRSKAVAFSRDGKLVGSGFGRWVGVWDAESMELLHDLPLPFPSSYEADYDMGPVDVRFSSGNEFLFVGTGDQRWCRFDLESGEVLSSELGSGELVGLAPTETGLLWATADGRVWPEGVRYGRRDWYEAHFGPSGLRFTANTGDKYPTDLAENVVEEWSVSGESLGEYPGRGIGYHESLGPIVRPNESSVQLDGRCYQSDGRYSSWRFTSRYLSDGDRVWRLGQEEPLFRIPEKTFSHLWGSCLAISEQDRILVYDLDRSLEPRTIPFPGEPCPLRFAPQGNRFVVQREHEFSCWTTEPRRLWSQFLEHFYLQQVTEAGYTVGFRSTGGWPGTRYVSLDPQGEVWGPIPASPFSLMTTLGDRLLLGGSSNQVEVFSLRDGSLLRQYQGSGNWPLIRRNRWFPELKLVLGEGFVDLCSVVHGGRQFYRFQRTSDDGELSVVQSLDGIAILDSRGELLARIPTPFDPLAAHFGPDQVQIFTESGDLHIWTIPENVAAR